MQPDEEFGIGTLYNVFSSLELVQKILLVGKKGNYHALVEFETADSAQHIKDALDGQNIPSEVMSRTPQTPKLKLSFSTFQNIKFEVQSDTFRWVAEVAVS